MKTSVLCIKSRPFVRIYFHVQVCLYVCLLMSTYIYVRDQEYLLPLSVPIIAFRFRTYSLNATPYFRRALAVPEAGKPGLASSAPASDLHLVGTNYQLIASLCRNERSLPPRLKRIGERTLGASYSWLFRLE